MAIIVFAFTEYYVVPGGTGTGTGVDGTGSPADWANAMDDSDVAGNLAAGRRFNFAGAFTMAGSFAWTIGGSIASPIMHRGWKADLSAPATSFSDMPTFDGAGTFLWQSGAFTIYNGIRFTNGAGFSIATADNIHMGLVEIDNHSGNGALFDNNVSLYKCRVHDNGAKGVDGDFGLKIVACEIYDNVGSGVFLGSNYALVDSCFIARNANGVELGAGGNTFVRLSTIDDNGSGIIIGSSAVVAVIASQITNNVTGVSGVNANVLENNNFFGNGTDNTSTMLDIGSTFVDPNYVAIASNNYEIQEASLIGVDVPLLGNVNIGAWQNVGGGGGGIPYRPRIRKGA